MKKNTNEKDEKPTSEPRSIRFERIDLDRIHALAELWRCSTAAAVRRAVAVAAKEEGIP